MARNKDFDWNLPEKDHTLDSAQTALLMDIRDELKALNHLLSCSNFLSIPDSLRTIARQTRRKTKPKTKPKTKLMRVA